jgi:hypothetical protein
MKTILHLFLGILFAAAVHGDVPPVSVTVSDANGKTVYQGSTNEIGLFRTAIMPAGDYVVQFQSQRAAAHKNHYLLVVSAGKKKVLADAVNGELFAGGGVAMRVKVGRGLNIEGQMADESTVSVPGNPYVKVVNGHRYLWVASLTGSNLGPRWVDESVGLERNVIALDRSVLFRIQDHAGEGSMLNKYRGGDVSEIGEYH